MYRQFSEKDWSYINDTKNDTDDTKNDTDDTKRDTNDTKNDTNDTISGHDTKILKLILMNPSITQAELKEKLQVSLLTVKRLMSDLQKRGVIERQGSSRKGKWIILERNEKEPHRS